ncbi:MAG TPA: hypothetical protein VF989_00890 [Polyangiaceae bacterium]|jgi:DNA ligase-1
MLLARLVETSERVAAASARSEKIALLAGTLLELGPDEIAPGVLYLSGELPQRRLGVGYATLAELSRSAAADSASLGVGELDTSLSGIASLAGAGSSHARRVPLARIFERCTGAEQRFLHRLLVGELRQGALQGIMVEALARAARVPPSGVRRALMLSGSLDETARASLLGGAGSLDAFRLEPLRPTLRTLYEQGLQLPS